MFISQYARETYSDELDLFSLVLSRHHLHVCTLQGDRGGLGPFLCVFKSTEDACSSLLNKTSNRDGPQAVISLAGM